jgi:hypothetical protein
MKNKLIFVNSKPADCGCQIDTHDGYGKYATVVYITLCPKHMSHDVHVTETEE